MFDRDKINDLLQNRNFVMCMASLFFMCGIMSYFSQKELLSAGIITIVLCILLIIRIFDIKRVLILAFIFYFGFAITFLKVKESDELISLAPANTDFYGQIISIPNSAEKGKVKFFFKVEKAGDKEVKGKTLLTVSAEEKEISKLNIGQKITINGNLRQPFRSTNPSQFDYSSYLKNFGVFTVI